MRAAAASPPREMMAQCSKWRKYGIGEENNENICSIVAYQWRQESVCIEMAKRKYQRKQCINSCVVTM